MDCRVCVDMLDKTLLSEEGNGTLPAEASFLRGERLAALQNENVSKGARLKRYHEILGGLSSTIHTCMIIVTITFRRMEDCVGGVASMLAAVRGTMASTWILRHQQKV